MGGPGSTAPEHVQQCYLATIFMSAHPKTDQDVEDWITL